MKILVLSNLYPPDVIGGYELCCRQAADALRQRGHDVRVLTTAPRSPSPAEPQVRRTLRLTDVWSHYSFQKSAPITAHLTQSESHRVNAYNVHALLGELEEFQPDVVYVHMLIGIGGLALMACLHHLQVPWVWQLGDDVPVKLCQIAGRLNPTLAREFSRQLHGHFIPVSQQLLDAIETSGATLNGVVEVIPNWIVGPEPPPHADYFRGKHLRIAAAASIIDRQTDKGIDLAVEAAALLRDRGYDHFSLDIFGQVHDPYFPSLILNYGLNDRVTLKGSLPQDDLIAHYSEYDLFLFPTRPGEPFGVAPLEAAARGCVPLISQTCGIAEWLVHTIDCLKAPRTAAAFARTVSAVLDGSIDLEPIGRRASAVARREFHIDTIIPRIEDHLRRASRQSRAGAGTPEEAYRLALLAEKLSRVLIHESLCA
ncbi:MAG: glycosyltransferase family 4 protein [Isosphaeraceae bacterium]